MSRRDSGNEMEMGYPEGSVVSLPTTISNAKERYLRESAVQKVLLPLSDEPRE